MNDRVVATRDHIDRAREAGFIMDKSHISAWLYNHFHGKTWKNIWEESGPGFGQYQIKGMDLNLDEWQDGEFIRGDLVTFDTEWFDREYSGPDYQAETALYAAAVLWLAEHRPSHPGPAEAKATPE